MPRWSEKTDFVQEVRTAYRCPWQNPFAERFVGILRRELLDHIIPLNERHLERLLGEFIDDYYHPMRTHGGLNHEPPVISSSAVVCGSFEDAGLVSEPILGGLYHGYLAKAA